ncbi:hypothetical protein ACIRQH_01065 [Streptomyces sp. NPDC102279]|uniref:hypothetical protein n=1 Tax=Streptomyces sp. NPDC102279 TaxID=3366153 RepID=UPI003820E662
MYDDVEDTAAAAVRLAGRARLGSTLVVTDSGDWLGVVRETVLALLPCATDLPGDWLL